MSDLNDPLAFFDGDVKAPPAAAAPAAPEPAAPSADPAAPAPTASAPAAASGASDDAFPGAPAGYVPVRALQDERSKRKTLEEVVNGFQKPAPATPAPSAPKAPVQQRPVPQVGTAEHSAYLQDQLFQQQVSSKFDRSETMAVIGHGADVVGKAKEWAEANLDTTGWMGVIESADPYGKVITMMKQAEAAQNWTANQSDWANYQAWKATQAAGGAPTPNVIAPSVAAAQQATKSPSTPAVSRGSILSTPAAPDAKPGDVIAGKGEAFGGLFRK